MLEKLEGIHAPGRELLNGADDRCRERFVEGGEEAGKISSSPVRRKTLMTAGSPTARRSSTPRRRASFSACRRAAQAGRVDEGDSREVDGDDGGATADEPEELLFESRACPGDFIPRREGLHTQRVGRASQARQAGASGRSRTLPAPGEIPGG